MRALINAYLIDGTGGPARGGQTVLIDGERIAGGRGTGRGHHTAYGGRYGTWGG